jgi:urease accessory protein UreF
MADMAETKRWAKDEKEAEHGRSQLFQQGDDLIAVFVPCIPFAWEDWLAGGAKVELVEMYQMPPLS